MIRFFTTFFALGISLIVVAQSPQSFSYQGVARNNGGGVLMNQAIGVQVDIRETSTTGNILYTETHSTTTNDFGIFNLVIGTGAIVTGDFTTIDWGSGPYFIEVSMDATGGTDYESMGVSQLLSVPYALYAESSGNDAIQTLSFSEGQLSISDGNTISIYESACPPSSVNVNNAYCMDVDRSATQVTWNAAVDSCATKGGHLCDLQQLSYGCYNSTELGLENTSGAWQWTGDATEDIDNAFAIYGATNCTDFSYSTVSVNETKKYRCCYDRVGVLAGAAGPAGPVGPQGPAGTSGLWEELGTETLDIDTNVVEIVGFPARKHLKIIVRIDKQTSCHSKMTFNGSTTNNYRTKLEVNNSIVEASTNVNHLKLDDSGTNFQGEVYCVMNVINESSWNKLISYHTTLLESNGSVPEITLGSAAWVTGEQITSVKVKGCVFSAGSFISVYGHD